MFQQFNEFKYTAQTGKNYIVYFLQFWPVQDKKNDFVAKYQIRAPDKDFVWYGRISKERFLVDAKIETKDIKSMPKEELQKRIESHLKTFFVYIIKKVLDKGFEEPNTEFVFYKEPPITKRIWCE